MARTYRSKVWMDGAMAKMRNNPVIARLVLIHIIRLTSIITQRFLSYLKHISSWNKLRLPNLVLSHARAS